MSARGFVPTMEKITHLGETLTRWRVGQSTFLALPEKGARLMNWNLTLGDGSVRDVIYWPELTTFADFYKVRGGNPILFPFNARTFDRGEIHQWRAADGVRRPMPMHGVARQAEFKVTRLDATGFSAAMIPNDESRVCYPYAFDFVVTYRFSPLGLTCEFALTNHSQEAIPWSAGHHFYFTVPWSEGAKRSDYLIRLPAGQRVKQDFTNGQLKPGPTLKSVETMSNPDLIDTVHTQLAGNEIRFGERDRPGDVAVQVGANSVPPSDAAFVTWTLNDEAPFFCVEPWMGPPNAAEHKVGLHFVKPGATERFIVSVAIK